MSKYSAERYSPYARPNPSNSKPFNPFSTLPKSIPTKSIYKPYKPVLEDVSG